MCWIVVYFGVQEWLFYHQEERSNPGTVHVHQGIGRMKRLARSCVWWASLNGDLEAKVQICTKRQSSQPPELISCPDPVAHARKSVW